MNRIVILAAAAAALVAGSASAETAQTIRVSTVGKTPVQVRAEVFQAARKLCQETVSGYAYRIDEARACIDHTTRATFAQAQGASVAAR